MNWLSFTSQVTSGSGSSYDGVSLFTGDSTERLFIGQRNNQSTIGSERSGGSGDNSSTASLDQTFLVVRFDFTGTGESARLWVNPSLSSTPSDASAAATLTGLEDFTFDTIRVQSGSSTTFGVDELRFGTSFQDVAPVPEPVSLALAVFGGIGVGMWGVPRIVSRRQGAGNGRSGR